MRRRRGRAATLLLLSLAGASSAWAAGGERPDASGDTSKTPAPPKQRAPRKRLPAELGHGAPRGRSLDASGFILAPGRTQVGLLESYRGVTQHVSVGTLTLPWLLAPVLGGASANASVKVGARLSPQVWASLTGGALFAQSSDLSLTGVSAEVWAFPVTGAVSWRPSSRWTSSLALRYLAVAGDVRYAGREAALNAAAIADMASGIATLSYRSNARLAFVARGKLLLWRDDLRVRSDGVSGQTSVDLDASVSMAGERTAAAVLAAAQLSWNRVHLLVGAGYGNYFVPGLGFAVGGEPFVFPEIDLFVRF